MSDLDVIDEVVETDVLSSIENVIGSDDGDITIGPGADNTLSGEDGDDLLNGGEGSDTFAFEGVFGNDSAGDFEVGVDRLDFSDFGPDFGDQLVVENTDAGALLTLGNNGSVLLAGVDSLDTDDDFIA